MRVRWAVLGVGLAGRARARAILADPRSALVAVHRGRFADEVGAPQVSLDDAIHAADAVAVCSPTAHHAEQVTAALEAGRHVVVEFPLAPDAATAAHLLRRAADLDRVLHVEHIELLDPAQVVLTRSVARDAVRSITVSFSRPGPGDADAHELALGNVARLHRVVGVGGPVAAVDSVSASPGALRAQLTLAGGVPVQLRFEQRPDAQRATRLTVHAGATWVLADRALERDGLPVALDAGPPLFALDHAAAMGRIVDGQGPYVADARVLHVLDVVGALSALSTGPLARREP